MSTKNNTYFNTFGSVTSDGNLLPNNNVLYGPYNTKNEAFNIISSELSDKIPIGLTVGIIINNVIVEYWFSGGITIEHLIPKIDLTSHANSIYMSDGKTVEDAIVNKQEILVSGSNVKTVNGVSVLGEGDISIPKGDKGDKGEKGDKGDKGEKGDQGNSGFQGDFMDFEVVNNLTDGGSDKALSAEMGKELDWKAKKILNDATKYGATTNTEYISVSIAGTGFLSVDTTGTPQQSSSSWYSEFIPVSPDKLYRVLTVKSKHDASVGFYAEANFGSFISAVLNDAQDRLVDEFVPVPAGANYMVLCTRNQNAFGVTSFDKTQAASKYVEKTLELIQQQIDNGAINKLLGLTDNVFNPYYSDSIQEIQLYRKSDGTLAASKSESPFCYFIKIGRKCKIGKYYNFKIFSESNLSADLRITQLYIGISDKLQDGEKFINGSTLLNNKQGYFLADVESELYLYVKFISNAENIPFRLERLNEIVNSLVVTETDSQTYPQSYIPHRGLKFSLMREDVSGDTIYLYIVDSNNVQIGNKVELKIGNSNISADVLDSNYLNSVQSITYKLAENTVSEAVVVGEGWSGNALAGYSHTSGNTEALEFSLNNYTIGTKLIVRFKSDGITGESSDVLISVGDAPSVKTYNGSNSFAIGVVANGGNLKITPQSGFASVITDISIQEVDEEGEDEVTLKVSNVYAQQNAMITAFWNVAIGAKDNTLNQLVNGSRNVAIGNCALNSISSGNRNVAIGTFAMPFLTEAENNVAVGADTIYPLKRAFNCVGIGKATLGGSQKAENCVAIGAGAMGSYTLAIDRTNCVVIGVKSAPSVTENCTHVGYRAGANVAGARNTSIGYNSLAVGNRSTVDITGTDLTCVGSMSQIDNTDTAKAATNSTAIGANTTITKSNQVVIGNSQIEEVIIGGKKIIFNADGSCSWESV